MKERGILFRDRLVRAILEDRKTQTRRLAKVGGAQDPGLWGYAKPNGNMDREAGTFRSPYGGPGDRLWVREAWAPLSDEQRASLKRGAMLIQSKPEFERPGVIFRADAMNPAAQTTEALYGLKWKPGIHLFRRDARLILEVVEVHLERLQDISEEDAIAEGLERMPDPTGHGDVWHGATTKSSSRGFDDPRLAFASLWDSINGDKPGASWAANPWVWCITFQRIQGGA